MKHKLFLLALFASLLVGCAKESAEVSTKCDNLTEDINSHTVSEELALKRLSNFLSSVDPTTRGRTRIVKDITKISSAGICSMTRSTTSEQDKAIYVVNFEDNEGYAILGADDRLPPIFVVGDAGSFDPASLVGPYPIHLPLTRENMYSIVDQEYHVGSTSESGTEEMSLLNLFGIDVESLLEIENGGRFLIGGNIEIIERPEIPEQPDSDEPFVIGPLLLSDNWSQEEPFNNLLPEASGYVIGGTKWPAGCTTIAAAQIVAFLERPELKSELGIFRSSWEDIETFDPDGSYLTLTELDVASFIKSMAEDVVSVLYNFCGSGDSYATPSAVYRGLTSLGIDVTYCRELDMLEVFNSLVEGFPVFVSAVGQGTDSHAWVIDAVSEEPPIEYDDNMYGGLLDDDVEYRDGLYYHFNLGEGRESNGWYIDEAIYSMIFTRYNEGAENQVPPVITEIRSIYFN